MPLSSASARVARRACLSTLLVSTSVLGGSGGRPSKGVRGSKGIAQLPQVDLDGGIELARLSHLLAQHGGEPLHFLLERLAVVLLRLGTDIAAGREHVAMLADLLQRGA